ncbi:LANO_0H20054g1_1 [Lachancea nothofagi CBS 11611]|uniref:LANO_0H20054g1_1 n=1 Tax=Lachancea nothofagi CBS 11611 TaxID=1266666 RepID=A0A1G4KNK9_9SACH|nr:LANO_0H20054g1_1 [Lachancea nothofagi CBS 11611]
MAGRSGKKESKQNAKQGKGSKINDKGVLLVPPPKSIPNKDHMQRLNYLFQLSTFHTMVGAQDKSQALSRMYMKNLDLIQKKTKTALTPGMKRQICKECHRVQIPWRTVTSFIANESKKKTTQNQVLVLTCQCGSSKRFPFGRNREYRTHVEKDNLVYMQK